MCSKAESTTSAAAPRKGLFGRPHPRLRLRKRDAMTSWMASKTSSINFLDPRRQQRSDCRAQPQDDALTSASSSSTEDTWSYSSSESDSDGDSDSDSDSSFDGDYCADVLTDDEADEAEGEPDASLDEPPAEEPPARVVCGAPYSYFGRRGYYTGQVDGASGAPHGMGTWRSAECDAKKASASAATLLEGAWSRGYLYSKASDDRPRSRRRAASMERIDEHAPLGPPRGARDRFPSKVAFA
ncbi:hypothetical protein ACHAWF_002951 [Thalassiosira exigua]